MSTFSLSQAYAGNEPPEYHDCEHITDGKFAVGPISKACLETNNDALKLIGNAGKDPLGGLHRMGLFDLVNHDSDKDVTVVVPLQKNNELGQKIVDVTQNSSPLFDKDLKVLKFSSVDGEAEGRFELRAVGRRSTAGVTKGTSFCLRGCKGVVIVVKFLMKGLEVLAMYRACIQQQCHPWMWRI